MSLEGVKVEIPPDAVERIAERAAEIVLERLSGISAADRQRWLAGAQAAADYLGVPRARIYKGLHTIPHHRNGSRLMFRTDELDRWLTNQ